jgi:hypothetical protein
MKCNAADGLFTKSSNKEVKGVSPMRNLFKIFLVSLCVLSLSSTVIFANDGSDSLKADEASRIQPASISDLTYIVLVWTGSDLLPSYYPQFEFEAGNNLRATAVSSNWTVLTGTWTEVEFGDLFSYFTAQVEQEDPPTTTTISIPPTERENQAAIPVQPLGTKMIDLWGISFNFAFGIDMPDPVTDIGFGVSMLIGAGTYLGKNAVFAGFSGVDTGNEPAFGTISPSTGVQESTPHITISCSNTTFRDDPPVDVEFIPNDGLTVGSISTTSNTEIEFDLTIAVDAPTTTRSVTVSWDDPPQTVTGDAVFTVTAKP